ncbi:MAG: hypothetical protein JO086_17345 [Acidimicrobiia bacterium]|nr:hypothetical protein [Acidimicrobiia bacterium]
MTRTLRLGAMAVGIAALASPLVGAGPAAAVGNPAIVVTLPARAELSSTGKAVRFRVAVTCSNMVPVPIDVHLAQTRSQTKVNGTGASGTTYKCNGHTQRVPVIVFANSGRFNAGGATATASATCGSTQCAFDTRNVQLFSKS